MGVTDTSKPEEGRQYLVSPEPYALQRGGLRRPLDVVCQKTFPATMYA